MICEGSGDNGLALIVDSRGKFCHETGTLLRDWSLGRNALGRGQWHRTLRIALREYGTEPWTAKEVKAAKDGVAELLAKVGIRCVVPVQTANFPGVRQVHSAWNMFGHPGNPYKWAGTVERHADYYVAPILAPGNYEYVYGWLLERWLRQALAVAQGQLRPMPWPEIVYVPGKAMLEILQLMRGAKHPVAIDIETNMAGTIITAIGFSNLFGTVSVPWHQYNIAGTNGQQSPEIGSYKNGRQIAEAATAILGAADTPKILHNGTFDVVQLAKHGVPLRGFDWDTLLLHRVVYPQFRHGLQQAAATEFCVEPWKCLFKPPRVRDGSDIWLGDPVALRQYNGKDTYATWQLWKHLKAKIA